MGAMGSRPTHELLQLPVRLHGIRLGHPVDVLLDVDLRRALGFVVRCGDESIRFLPYAAAQPRDDEIAVASALMLLEDVGFYSERSSSLRDLLGAVVRRGAAPAGVLRDLVLAGDGRVEALVVERDGELRGLAAADGVRIEARRAPAA
jgi:hypothetical protein